MKGSESCRRLALFRRRGLRAASGETVAPGLVVLPSPSLGPWRSGGRPGLFRLRDDSSMGTAMGSSAPRTREPSGRALRVWDKRRATISLNSTIDIIDSAHNYLPLSVVSRSPFCGQLLESPFFRVVVPGWFVQFGRWLCLIEQLSRHARTADQPCFKLRPCSFLV